MKQLVKKQFANVWNDVSSYPTIHDLERVFGVKFKTIRQRARRYTQHRLNNPDENLPELVWRKATTGGVIPVPESVIRQLDTFRFYVENFSKMKGVVVTSAQFGAELNKHFWKSLCVYAKAKGFPLLVLPIKYGNIKIKDGQITSLFPDELKGHMVFEDVSLCNGELNLNTVRMRPTLVRFLTDQVCEMGGQASQIMAAPKLELEHRPRIGHKYPKAIMTTGSCTHPNYHVDKLGQQDRTGEVAVEEHTYSAIVVEFEKDSFHFRQLLANKKGEFYDINPVRFYKHTGYTDTPDDVSALVLGDWHVGRTHRVVRSTTFGSVVKTLKPDNIVFHDFVDCESVSHWEEKQSSRRAFKAPLQWDSLEDELKDAVKEIRWIQSKTDAKLHLVASNHPEQVTEYIEHMRWVKDNRNLYIGTKLFTLLIEEMQNRKPIKSEAGPVDPVVLWFKEKCPEVNSLERQDILIFPKKNGILCSMHGDIGVRGARTRSMREFCKMNYRITLGHNHSAAILGPIWRVGTSTYRRQHYVREPNTNWTNTHQVIFKNGQRQLFSIVKGKWHG